MRSRFCRCRTHVDREREAELAGRAAPPRSSSRTTGCRRSGRSPRVRALDRDLDVVEPGLLQRLGALAREQRGPAVTSVEYRPASRAARDELVEVPAHAAARRRSARAGARRARAASSKTRTQCSVVELVAVASRADVERVRAVRAVQRAAVRELRDERVGARRRHRSTSPRSAIAIEQLAHVVRDVGAVVALRRARRRCPRACARRRTARAPAPRSRSGATAPSGIEEHVLARARRRTAGGAPSTRRGRIMPSTSGRVSPRSIASSWAHSISVLNLSAATARSCCSRVTQRSTTSPSA